MTKPKDVFHQVINGLTNGVEGIMFGAKCIKSTNGKAAVFYWQENMVFKLDSKTREKALKLNGAIIGSHLYAPDKPMKGWISIPATHSDQWLDFTNKALEYVESLKK